MLGDCQAKTRAAGITRASRVDTVEPFKNAVQRLFRNADPLIDDANRHRAFGVMPRNIGCYRRIRRRIVDCVLNQVLHRRGERATIHTHRGRPARMRHPDINMLVFRLHGVLLGGIFDHIQRVHLLR